MKKSAIILLVLLALSLIFASCDNDPYELVVEGENGPCQVEGHSKDFHASAYDYTAGSSMNYDVVDGSIVAYKVPAVCKSHSFEVWRCAVCGRFFKVYVHSFSNGHCTVCGEEE